MKEGELISGKVTGISRGGSGIVLVDNVPVWIEGAKFGTDVKAVITYVGYRFAIGRLSP